MKVIVAPRIFASNVGDPPPVRPRRSSKTPGIVDDGAVAERALAPLHPSLEPAHHFAVRDGGGGAPAELAFVVDLVDRAAGRSDGLSLIRQQRCDLAATEVRAPIGVIHDEASLAAALMPHGEGGADRPAASPAAD